MVSRRASLALQLCAVLFVTTGFAATNPNKKSERDREGSKEWSVWALQERDLPDSGSGVPKRRSVQERQDSAAGDGGAGGSVNAPWYMADWGASRGTNPGMSDNGRYTGWGGPGAANWINSGGGDAGRMGNLINSNDVDLTRARGGSNSGAWNAGAPVTGGHPSNSGGVLYSNGPVNGNADAWTINFGFSVSNSFTLSSAATAGGFDFYVWMLPGDTMQTVGWSITSNPLGGTTFGSGTASVTNKLLFGNLYGYNVYEETVTGLNVALGQNTFWLTLQDAVTAGGAPAYWDENSGVGCSSPGCPSQAVENSLGTIPSESFDITTMGDNWQGGTGHWSGAGNWDNGVPGATSDVTIYSGGNDLVTLDVGSTTINSLTLGGPNNGTTSELTDGGVAQNLTITNGLIVGQTGILSLTGGSTVTAGADSSNAGQILLSNGSLLSINANLDNSNLISVNTGGLGLNVTGTLTNQASGELDVVGGSSASLGGLVNNGNLFVDFSSSLNLTNQPNGITDVPLGAQVSIQGNFTAGANSALANLTSVEGYFTIQNSQTTDITPGGGVFTMGPGSTVDEDYGTTLVFHGDVLNDGGTLSTSRYGPGGNTLNITGMLTNSGSFELLGAGDTASVGGTLMNTGFVDVEGGSTLTVTGAVTNLGNLYTDATGNGGGNTLNFNSGLLNNGYVDVDGGSTLNVTGDVTNNAELFTDVNTASPFNAINITGNLTNNGHLFLKGFGDSLSVTGDMTNSNAFELAGAFETGMIGGSLTNTGFFFDVENGSTLTVMGDVTNSGSIYTSYYGSSGNTVSITGNLNNSGAFQLNGPGDMASIGGNVTNNGAVVVDQGSTLTAGGDLSVGAGGGAGSMTITNGASVTNQNGFVGNGAGSSGTVTVSGNGSNWLNLGNLSVGINGGSGLVVVNNGGTVTAQVLTIGAGGEVDPKGGTLIYSMLNNGGILDPVGTANLIGTMLTVFSQGSVVLDVLGKAPGQYGQLDITGSALFDGKTVIDFMNGFAPKQGDVFNFISITGTGNFSGNMVEIEGLEPGFEYSIDFSNGEFTLTALNNGIPETPEPATLLVLIPGLLGMGYGLRRKLLM